MAMLKMRMLLMLLCWVAVISTGRHCCRAQQHHDYQGALSKSIMFFEGQRSGYLPQNQRINWRRNSALQDGFSASVDLVGGYYDAGDNIKFGFPMAFTITTLSWSVIEFADQLAQAGELSNALDAIRWGTDFFLKAASASPDRFYFQVGDPNADHACWERPEDMDTPRTVYSVDAQNPGSEVAAETAAALAAASIAFRSSDSGYSQRLFATATQLFEFADTHRGSYSDSNSLNPAVCPFYCDFDGYQDELLWGASWLHKASGEYSYLQYLKTNGQTFGASDAINEFGWDNKHAGINVLVSKEYLSNNVMFVQDYKVRADSFVCSLLPETSYPHVSYTPGGLIYKTEGSNMQDVTALSLLLLVYAKYMEEATQSVYCGNVEITASRLRAAAKRQVDYILGTNPVGLSYMVGYSDHFPQRIHHRASSLPSVSDHPATFPCKDAAATFFYNTTNANPNLLVGAVVGGPDANDAFQDSRPNFRQSEPTTYINSPLVGALAYFASNPSSSS